MTIGLDALLSGIKLGADVVLPRGTVIKFITEDKSVRIGIVRTPSQYWPGYWVKQSGWLDLYGRSHPKLAPNIVFIEEIAQIYYVPSGTFWKDIAI